MSDSSDSDDEAPDSSLSRRQLRKFSAALLGSQAAACLLQVPQQQLTGVLLSLGGLMAQHTGTCLEPGDEVREAVAFPTSAALCAMAQLLCH